MNGWMDHVIGTKRLMHAAATHMIEIPTALCNQKQKSLKKCLNLENISGFLILANNSSSAAQT